MNTGPTTDEEVADIVFNSEDSELNDMLQQARSNNYEINYLIWKMAIDINVHFGAQLESRSTSPIERRSYLFKHIKSELVFYAKWYEV